ncbi:calcium-translocating P-type ATPase, PMCA-type [Candidatus Woesearchaeota archaeon CG10_big_fil_rev_8_21_14_0_10_34_8]|nr:MAG: calcium-translocating P-type ATPase, PMCA-type [Candidatus Woesearchaeota archaeon CG10_big_fil_rev_8_21_14_0_10_34_8]
MTDEYYNKTLENVEKELETSIQGLSSAEAKKRLEKYGLNEIKEKKKVNPLIIFLSQFNSVVVYILIGAVIISALLGEYVDSIVIMVILIFNAVFGFIQEYKAEKSIEALKKMASLKAKVMRNNKVEMIDAKELVPGDILLLEEGDKIPADGRLIETIHINTLESALTGESAPVTKVVDKLGNNLPLGDQKNMVFSGTVVTAGRAKAVITATGMNRQIGKIASMIQEAGSKSTPLQIRLNKLGKVLGIGTIIVCLIVFGAAVFKGEAYLPAFLAAVALAVAAIPEGLPAVVTISLALGVQRMIKKNALVRKLPSVETLGCTTVICTDKTGTLTKNEMTVRSLYTNGKIIEVTGSGYSKEGSFFIKGKKVDSKEVELLLKIGLLNNNANLENEKVIGDPTEGCLIVSAEKAGLDRKKLESDEKRIDEVVFNSTRKRMSTVNKSAKQITMYTKGAPDIILNYCTKINVDGKVRKITSADKKKILEVNQEFASAALRVLGFAYKELKPKNDYDEKDENDLVFVGLQGMIDPPREEVKDSILKCKEAGIRVVMITGDYGITAKAIGSELGIGTKIMTGKELETHEHLEDIVEEINIFARVDPAHKLKIVEALKKKGHIVAMTGDGVNDAPALKEADIGIAMGITGTDVSKEASDMILTDDNFTSIVNAVEEGRGIYGNIKKYFSLLLSGNIVEVLIVFLVTMMGFPLPLIAIQILMINLVTDGFPALALGIDPFEPGVMKQKPRKKDEPLYRGLMPYLILSPLIMTVCGIAVFYYVYTGEGNLVKAQTMTFVMISLFQLFLAFACRSTLQSSFKVGLFKNYWLIGAVALSSAIVVGVVYVPVLQPLFGTISLSWMEFGTIIVVASFGAISIEIAKLFRGFRSSV